MNHRANIVENKIKWNSNNLREVIKYHTEKDSIVNEDRKRIINMMMLEQQKYDYFQRVKVWWNLTV